MKLVSQILDKLAAGKAHPAGTGSGLDKVGDREWSSFAAGIPRPIACLQNRVEDETRRAGHLYADGSA